MNFNSLSLSGKTALVMGSTQGIGLASARLMAERGANLILCARNAQALEEAVKSLAVEGSQKHCFCVADQADTEQLTAAIHALVKSTPIDILVNNSGGPAAGEINQALPEQFEAAFRQHLIANHVVTTAIISGMKKQGFGRIINIISTSVKQPLKGLGVSNTIRAAVGNWAKTLANELGPFGITVNNVLPGATLTQRLEQIIRNKAEKTGHNTQDVEKEMVSEIPAGRFGLPEEIAEAVAFLASPAAAYINGINVPVDGGRTSSL